MANFVGTFKRGMKIGKDVHMEFELRPMTTEDLLDAELEVPMGKPMNFNAALAALQLVRVGDFDGPFTINMVRKLDPVDFQILRESLGKVAALGEESSPNSQTD